MQVKYLFVKYINFYEEILMSQEEPKAILVDVVELSKMECEIPVRVKLRFATTKNFIGAKIDGYEVDEKHNGSICLLSSEAAKDLCKVQAELNQQGYSLYLYDAYRPKRAVSHFWNWSENLQTPSNIEIERKNKHYPLVSKEKFFELGYVAKDSTHCYGHTLDTEVINLKINKPLFMGARISYMGAISHSTATQESIKAEWGRLKELSAFDDIRKQWWRATGELWQEEKEDYYVKIALDNRKILKNAMLKYNFSPYEKEWWHYSHKNKQSNVPMDFPITEDLKGLGFGKN